MADTGISRIVRFGYQGPTGPTGPTGAGGGGGGDLDGDVIGASDENVVAAISGDEGEVFVPAATYFRLFASNGPAFGKFRMPYSGSNRSIFSMKTDELVDANVLRTQGILVELGDSLLATDFRGIDINTYYSDSGNGCLFKKVNGGGSATAVGGFRADGTFASSFSVEAPLVKLVPTLVSNQGSVGGIHDPGDAFNVQNYYSENIAPDGSPLALLTLPVQPDNSHWDIELTVNAKQSSSANNAVWKFDVAYYRNGGAATLMGTDTAVVAKGNTAGAPPVGWTCVLSIVSNQLVVTLTTAAGVYVMANAKVSAVTSP